MSTDNQETAYIGIGSNLADRAAYINKALSLLDKLPGLKITKLSKIIETAPLGGPENQPHYLNGVAQVRCHITAENLLLTMQSIENQLERKRDTKWDARTIDLDLILFGSDVIKLKNPDLRVPHPLMHQRLFVMEPLAQIAPDLLHPQLNLTMKQILQSLQSASNINPDH